MRDRLSTAWTVHTAGSGWSVRTDYEFLHWEDLVRQDFSGPAGGRIARALATLIHWVRGGVVGRMLRASRRFLAFVLYPYVVLAAEILVSAGLGFATYAAFSFRGMLAFFAGAGVFVSVLIGLVSLLEPKTFMLYLFSFHASALRYAKGLQAGWDRRFDQFAAAIVDAVRESDTDEVVLVGHSLGACVAADVLTRALAIEPALGQLGPRVMLCTLGGNFPLVGFQPEAAWFQEKLARLSNDSGINWRDYQSRKDVINFSPFHPVTGHGLAAGRNPIVSQVNFREMLAPDKYRKLRRRFFEMHFQFLKASESPASTYDYITLCCGPDPF